MPETEELYCRRLLFRTRLLADRLYTPSHFWIQEREPGVWRIGLTKFASRMLGDIVEVTFERQAGDGASATRSDRSKGSRRSASCTAVRAHAFLRRAQREDGAFVPLWFGNQHEARQQNPLYGTTRVVLRVNGAAGTLDLPASDLLPRAIRWIMEAQHPGGG